MTDPHDTIPCADKPCSGSDPAKRQQILEGARQIFRARGFDGASMGDIAKAAGVSKGTLYVYFDSKEGLFTALTIEERRGQAESVFRLDPGNPDVAAELRKLAARFLDMVTQPEKISNIRMVIGAAEQFPHLGQAFYDAGPGQGLERLKRYFDAQVAAGRLAIPDTALAAQHFIDLAQAGCLRRALFSVGEPPSEADRAAYADAAIQVFLAAYGT